MNVILEQINSASMKFVEFALPMFVQSVVLIVILLLADFVLRKKVRAVFRYWIWLLVFVKLVLPTSLSSPLSLGYFFGDRLTYVGTTETPMEPQTNVVQPVPASVPPFIDLTDIEADRFTPAAPPIIPEVKPALTSPADTPAMPVTPLSWQGAVFLTWLTVVIAMVLLLLQRAIFVRGLVAQAKEANGVMADMLESCSSAMSIKRKLGLKISTNAASPAVCGLFRPVILVPQNLASSLTAGQLRAVLLHELAHIRRGDLFVNLAQTVLQIIYFYNPLLWLANCIIRRIREQAVDEMVLVVMGEKASQYPQTLVSVAKLAFKRPALSLRLIGVVESKSALSGRIKHILNRPMPKKTKLGILGLLVVIIVGAILLPMVRALKPMSAGQGGPLDIRLTGVRPDGSDDIYDGNGNKIAENTFANIASAWRKESQHRTFIFELSKIKEPILFSPFTEIKPAGTDRGLNIGRLHLFSYLDNKLRCRIGVAFPRTYKRIFERRIKKVDLTLRYYYGPQREAAFKFTGPFTEDLAVEADNGKNWILTPEKDRLNFTNRPTALFKIAGSGKTPFDIFSVLIYDTSGRRHLVNTAGGGGGRSNGSGFRGGYNYRADGLTLNSIACVTIGEKPYEAVFKNVVVSYPDRPARDRMEFLDEMCKRLGLTGLSGEQLYQYDFEKPADAIKVIDIVRGHQYVRKVFKAIWLSKPKIQLSNLDPQAQQKIRSAAARWAEVGDLRIRAMGIRLGVMSGWPEFMDLAMEWLEQDVTEYGMLGRAYLGLEERVKGEVAGEVARCSPGLKNEYFERIKKIILRTDNPSMRVRLFALFWRTDKDMTFQTCWDLVQDDRPWIWWPAMYLLSSRCTEKLKPFDNLPEKIQKRLILIHENRGGTTRILDISTSGKKYETLAKEAHSMLPGLLTPELARKNSLAWYGVYSGIIKNLDSKLATQLMIKFLREISTEQMQNLWVSDGRYFGHCCSMTSRIVRTLNGRYGVLIGGLEKYEPVEGYAERPFNIGELKQLIAATMQWYYSRRDADNESSRVREIGAGNKAGQLPVAATLPNGVTVEHGNTDTTGWVIEDYGQTRLLSDKEIIDTDNWISIWGNVVKNKGRYLVPDRGLTLKDLIKAAGYNRDKLAQSYVELCRRNQHGNISTRLTYSRNLKTLLSSEESDIVIKPHDSIGGGYIEPSANGVEFWSGYHFGEVVELTVNDDGAKVNMFADLDSGRLITPPDTLDFDDENAVLRWIKETGIDVMGETATTVHGVIGFNMYAARVDNYFWDAGPREITDRLMVRIDDPVLLNVENLLPVTYLIKTSEYKLGILQILGFVENPKGIKIRYKLINKEAAPKPDVRIEAEPESGNWQYIGQSIPPDFNDTMILTEHVNLGSIGHDAEGKTFITFVRDGQEAPDRQYRFVLFNKAGNILEPDGHIVLSEGKRLEEKFTFDEPFITRQLKGFRFQRRSLPPSGVDNISSQLQKSASEVVKHKTLLPSDLPPPGRYAVELDGVDDYLLVPDSPSLRLEPPFTIEMWIKTKLPPDTNEYRGGWALISKGFTVGTPRAYLTGFGINLDRFPNEPSKLHIDFSKANNSGTYSSMYAGYPLTNGVSDWIHITHVFKGDHYKSTPGHPLVMGKFLIPTNNPFKGLLGEVRLWNGARTRQKLRQYKNVALSGTELGLAACWTFEQTEGQYAYDISGNNNHARLGKSIEADDADPKWIDLQMSSPQPNQKTNVQAEIGSILSEATGCVVDVNGQGVSGATLKFYKYGTEKKSRKIVTTMTDKTGRFHIPVIRTGEHMSVWISAQGFAKRHVAEPVYPATDGSYSDGTYSTDNLIFKLKGLGIIEGQVIGPNGNSLVWAPLSLSTTVRYPNRGEATSNHFRAITDEQGHFRMEDVPPGTHLLYYPWSGPSKGEVSSGRWRAFHGPDERWPSAPVKGICAAKVIKLGDGELCGIVIDLSKSTCAVEGQVHDTHGRVVADAMVSLYWVCPNGSGWGPVNGKGYPPVATDAEGRYRLQNLPPGDWHIRTWHDKVEQQSEPVPIELKPGRTIQQDLTLSGQPELDALKTDVQSGMEKR